MQNIAQHITQPSVHDNSNINIRAIIQQILEKVDKQATISERVKLIAIQQTLKALISDANFGILNSAQNLREHIKNVLFGDWEPQALETVDDVSGHV